MIFSKFFLISNLKFYCWNKSIILYFFSWATWSRGLLSFLQLPFIYITNCWSALHIPKVNMASPFDLSFQVFKSSNNYVAFCWTVFLIELWVHRNNLKVTLWFVRPWWCLPQKHDVQGFWQTSVFLQNFCLSYCSLFCISALNCSYLCLNLFELFVSVYRTFFSPHVVITNQNAKFCPKCFLLCYVVVIWKHTLHLFCHLGHFLKSWTLVLPGNVLHMLSLYRLSIWGLNV